MAKNPIHDWADGRGADGSDTEKSLHVVDDVFATVEEALSEISNGRMVVVVDDADRENEGDLTIAAEFVTPDVINFMATYGRGLICLALTQERCVELELDLMSPLNESNFGTAFTVSIDAREGTTTGISAADRARTIRTVCDPASGPEELVRPGHVFPLKARPGGVLERAGQTEAAVDLARLAGLNPAGVICEIMNEDGTMARVPDLVEFCREHDLKMVRVADIIHFRRRSETLCERITSARLPTRHGLFEVIAYLEPLTGKHHLALVHGSVAGKSDVLVRVHSECLTGDALGSLRCDCGDQLNQAFARIAEEGAGVLLYMSQEGRGIGLLDKLRAYDLQDEGLDTVDANLALGLPVDARDYGVGAQILNDIGLTSIRLLSNNPKKVDGLSALGIEVSEQIPITVMPSDDNSKYLAAKRDKLGHRLHHQDYRFGEPGQAMTSEELPSSV